MLSSNADSLFKGADRNLSFDLGVIFVLIIVVSAVHLFGTPRVERAMDGALWIGACLLYLLGRRQEGPRLGQIGTSYFVFLSVYSVLLLLKILYLNIVEPHEWDFLAKYIEGGMAVSGINFYQADSYELIFRQLTVPIEPSDTFRQEIFDVGFKYLPPFIFLVTPLGFFSYGAAQVVWFAISLGFLVGSAVLIGRHVNDAPGDSLRDSLFVFSFIALFPSTRIVFYYGQTHLVILFLVIAILCDIERNRAGVWVALSSFVKPFGALLGLVFLLRGRWRTILLGICTGLVGFLLTGIVFGFDILQSFFLENPNRNVPDWQYVQPINQSISATLLRLFDVDLTQGHPLTNPIVLTAIILLVATSCFLIVRVRPGKLTWGFALSLALAVVVYPGALDHYSIYLLVPVFLMLLNAEFILTRILEKIAFLVLVLAGLEFQPVLANLLCWLIIALMTYHFRKPRVGAVSGGGAQAT